MAEKQEADQVERGLPKYREGIVQSAKMDKTVVIAVTRMVKHRYYGKYVKRTKTIHAHDEKNECEQGDTVRVIESRPLSKTKRWRVQKVITKAVKV